MVTPTRSANIHTRSPRATVRSPNRFRVNFRLQRHALSGFLARTAAVLSLLLLLGNTTFSFAQPPQSRAPRTQSKKKSKKSKATPCRAGCGLNTSAPEITSPTPGDAAAQTELGLLARELHTATPGAYEKLSAFAARNAANVWGARAALALGYEDYTKNRLPQALSWFAKAKHDALLREYVLYWSAQAKRSQKRMADAFADLQTFQQEYPNS